MALSDNATAQLWETFRAGGGAGLIREAVELVLQELIEAEAAEAIGAGADENCDVSWFDARCQSLLDDVDRSVEFTIRVCESKLGENSGAVWVVWHEPCLCWPR